MPYRDKEVQKSKTRERQLRKRRELYDYKESNPCFDCGKYFHFSQMQFDHKANKSFPVSQRSASFGSEKFMKELEKCDLICANCHALRTWKRLQS